MSNSDPLPVAVLYDRADAVRFLSQQRAARSILALSPAARAELPANGLPAVSLADLIGDHGHAALVTEAAAIHQKLWALTEGVPGLGAAARSTLCHGSHPLVTLALAVRVLLAPPGPWLIPSKDGFVCEQTLEAAARRLIDHIQDGDRFSQGLLKRDGWSWLTSLLGGLAARLVKPYSLVILGERYGLGALARKAAASHLRTLALRGAAGGWRDAAHAGRSVVRALCGDDLVQLVASPRRPDGALAKTLRGLLGQLDAPWLEAAAGPSLDRMIGQAVLVQALVPRMRGLLRRGSGARVVLHSTRWLDEAALAQAAGELGLHRVLVSHGSHAWPQEGPAAIESRVNADGLLTSPLADETLVQSPLADAFAAAARPEMKRRAFRPIMWGYKPMPGTPAGDRPLRILHAGTFKPLTAVRPFIYESAGEYVAGLDSLVRAVGQLDGVRLAIRLRSGRECDAKALARLLPDNGCWEISAVPNFLDDLAASDVLVSFASTTIEEAVQGRRPVLLWGGSQRYRHVPAQTHLPSAGARAAVYAVEDEAQLTDMLHAIMVCHRGQPLIDDEMAGYSWGTGTPGLEEFLAEFPQNR